MPFRERYGRRLVPHRSDAHPVRETGIRRPVEHVREVRTLLLIKSLFLARAGLDAGVLVERQRSMLEPVIGGLEARLASADGFERTLVLWRLESATAAVRFLDRLDSRGV